MCCQLCFPLTFLLCSLALAGRGRSEPPASPEKRILDTLNTVTSVEFVETRLVDVVEQLEDRFEISIEIDAKALDDVGLSTDVPITRSLKNIRLKSALRLILADLDLNYVVADDVLFITTPEVATSRSVTRVYSLDCGAGALKVVKTMLREYESPCVATPTAIKDGTLLIVRAPEAAQYEIDSFLAQIAEASAFAPEKGEDAQKVEDPFSPRPASKDEHPFAGGGFKRE